MIPLTSARPITVALLVFSLFGLSACDDTTTLQESITPTSVQEETVLVQETIPQEEAAPTQEETIPAQEIPPMQEATPVQETPPVQEATSTLETVSVQQLPPEAQQTLKLIYQSGPFPYDRDGIVFGNREKLLPLQPNGYYREYTVPTPGAKNRGARRIVCGGEKPSAPDRCYYTGDHYLSFQFILDETAQPDATAKP